MAWDLVTNPDEITVQGTIGGLDDVALGFLTGGATGAVAKKFALSTSSKYALGIAEGVASDTALEYARSRGSLKNHEESKKEAIANIGGSVAPTIASTFMTVRSNPAKAMEVSNDDIINETLKNPILREVKKVEETENISTQAHTNVKEMLKEAYTNGATKEELIQIRDSIPVDLKEKEITKIINNGEPTSSRLSGFRLVAVIEDTIKTSNVSPDEVKAKLLQENVSDELATVAAKSYMVKDTEILTDFIQARLETNLESKITNFKDEIKPHLDKAQKEILADEKNWANSPTLQSLRTFIKEETGIDDINNPHQSLVEELHKIGLVDKIESKKLDDINGIYKNRDITINKDTPKIDKMQVLTHEYVHSATTKLLEIDSFKNEVTTIMGSAKQEFKKQGKDFKAYGFENLDEFVAEAFSNPKFAKDLNDVKITPELQKSLGVKENITSLWEAIVDKFNSVVYATTGKRLKIDKDSYFGALNDSLNKHIKDVDEIQNTRIKDKSSIENNPKLNKYYDEDVDVSLSDEVLGTSFSENLYLNKKGELVENGKPLFMSPARGKTKKTKNIKKVVDGEKPSTQVGKTEDGDILIFEKGRSWKKFSEIKGWGLTKIIDKHVIKEKDL